jgi:predicted DNA binding CopG/RHH family protein
MNKAEIYKDLLIAEQRLEEARAEIEKLQNALRNGDADPAMKRFTIDVPLPLHTRIKTECSRRGLKMADMMREMLEKHFP